MMSADSSLAGLLRRHPRIVRCAAIVGVAFGAVPLGAWLRHVTREIVIFGLPLGPSLMALLATLCLLALASRARQ